jgi:hypothetical protein
MAHPQTWDPELYARNARFVAELATPVLVICSRRAPASASWTLAAATACLPRSSDITGAAVPSDHRPVGSDWFRRAFELGIEQDR